MPYFLEETVANPEVQIQEKVIQGLLTVRVGRDGLAGHTMVRGSSASTSM